MGLSYRFREIRPTVRESQIHSCKGRQFGPHTRSGGRVVELLLSRPRLCHPVVEACKTGSTPSTRGVLKQRDPLRTFAASREIKLPKPRSSGADAPIRRHGHLGNTPSKLETRNPELRSDLLILPPDCKFGVRPAGRGDGPGAGGSPRSRSAASPDCPSRCCRDSPGPPREGPR